MGCFFRRYFVYKNKANFTIIVITQTITNNIEKSNVLWFTNELIESNNNFADTIIIEILIKKENMYSDFPWPKLWSLSPGLLEILLPINVNKELKISPALLKLSAIIAWLLNVKPANPFIKAKKRLPKIPRIPALFALS